MPLGLPSLLSIRPALYLAVRLSNYQNFLSSFYWFLFERAVRSTHTTQLRLLTRTIHLVTAYSRAQIDISSVTPIRQELSHQIRKALHTLRSQIQHLGNGLQLTPTRHILMDQR